MRRPCGIDQEAFEELKEALDAQIGAGGLPKLRRSGPWITFFADDLSADTGTFLNLYNETKAKVEKRKPNATDGEVQQAFERRVDRMVRKIKKIRLLKKKKDLRVAVKDINETLRNLKNKRRRKMTVCVHKDFQVKKGNLVYVPVFKSKNAAFKKMNKALETLKTKEFVYGVKHRRTMYYYHYDPSVYLGDPATGHLKGTEWFRTPKEMLDWGGFGGKEHQRDKRKAKITFLNRASLPKGLR